MTERTSGGGRLGAFLRARRELLTPEAVGLPSGGRRRVPGLRRQELAMLAGISTEYYIRLEQGRDQRPSPQVVEGLAQALRLDLEATAHLHRLAGPAPSRRATVRPERVPPGIHQLIANWVDAPAFVVGRFSDVLTANPLAGALSPLYRTGVNMLRESLLNPAVQDLHRDWEALVDGLTAGLRSTTGTGGVDCPRLAALVGELSLLSEHFSTLWARHDVKPKGSASALIDHPQVGLLELSVEKLVVIGAQDLVMVVLHPEPGSPSAQRLALLARLAQSTAEVPAEAPLPAD